MADTEREASPSDLELEITDLDPLERPPRPRWPRLTPRQRKWSLSLTTGLFVLVIGVILASSGDMRGLLARTLFPPQPTAVDNNLIFYLQGNPSWGRFIIDGRPVAHLPREGRDPPLELAPGQHIITWQVAPFKDQTCVFNIDDTITVSSSCLRSGKVSANFVPNVPAMVLTFFDSMNDLPASQHAALASQLQAVMDGYGGSDLVRPGELYAVSGQQIAAHTSICTVVGLTICYARASQPLRATLRAQVDSSLSPNDPCATSEACSRDQQDCRALCSDTGHAISGWNVTVPISLLWTYTTLSGQVVARDQPDSALKDMKASQMASVHITRDSQGWHIFLLPRNAGNGFDDPVCTQAAQDIGLLAGAADGNQQLYVQQVAGAQSAPAAGCLAVVKTIPGTYISSATPAVLSSSQLTGYCLVRFGVVLTVDHQARQFWPSLPVANAYEQALANAARATLPPLS